MDFSGQMAPGHVLLCRLPRYRLAFFGETVPRTVSKTRKMVEPRGIEPLTSSLRTTRSPS